MTAAFRFISLNMPRGGIVRRQTYICLRLMEGADIYQIAKNCRTSVEMILRRAYQEHDRCGGRECPPAKTGRTTVSQSTQRAQTARGMAKAQGTRSDANNSWRSASLSL